jgi:transposase-like protein
MPTREEFNERRRRQNRYFSESFRKKKVKEIEQNISTVSEVAREYEVSLSSVYKWLYKYSLRYKKQVKQVVEPMSDTRKIKALKEEIKTLHQLIGEKEIKHAFLEKMIEQAEQEYDIDIKKKFGFKRSSGSGNTESNTPGA